MIYIDASQTNGNSRRTQTLDTKSNIATTSTAIPSTTILVTCDNAHYIATGPNPTATTSSFVIPSGAVLEFSIALNDKVSALSHSSQGHLSIAY